MCILVVKILIKSPFYFLLYESLKELRTALHGTKFSTIYWATYWQIFGVKGIGDFLPRKIRRPKKSCRVLSQSKKTLRLRNAPVQPATVEKPPKMISSNMWKQLKIGLPFGSGKAQTESVVSVVSVVKWEHKRTKWIEQLSWSSNANTESWQGMEVWN